MPRRFALLALLTAPLLASTGCGGADNSVWITGTLLKGGAAYVPPSGQVADVTFVALEIRDASGKTVSDNEPFQADLNPTDGSFSVPGRNGQGIPPGKYRVAVTQKMTRETLNALAPKSKPRKGAGPPAINRETDMLANKFGLDTSPILFEVGATRNLTIDLDNPTR